MEDNIGEFFEPIIDRISKYLNELPEDWDVVYDSVWGDYNALGEEKIDKKKLIYKKSNQITKDNRGKVISHGGTRAAQFYLLNYKSAKKLYDNFLPFNHSATCTFLPVSNQYACNPWAKPSFNSTKPLSIFVLG